MWKVNILSSPISHSNNIKDDRAFESRLTITSTRVCQHELNLPDGVYVVCADPAAADLSSSAMFTINKAPYLFTTACSDGLIRFWSCKESECSFEFVEWKLNSTIEDSNEDTPSQVLVDSFPLAISCSYNSRFAVAYKKQPSNTHYYVKIYECESTGGSQWKCEDCIDFKVYRSS